MKEIYINADDYNSDSIRTIQGNNNAEEYKIYLQYDNEKIDLTGKTVNLGFLRVGSTEGDIIENLNVTNAKEGEITLKITNKLTKKNGTYSCQLAILGEEDFLEHTATFTLTVENNIFKDITKAIADSKDFTYLENILDKASKLSEKLKENTSSATNTNNNLESNIIEANNINSKLLENNEKATSLNKNLESNIDLAKEVKETIKDLDTKNIEATEKIEELTNLNNKAEELSNNINQALPINAELIKNTESAKVANTNLAAANQEAISKNTELQASLEKTKEFIEGLDGSQNIPQIRLDVTELQNGLKSNQALAYTGSSISANNTLEGRTEGMKIEGKTMYRKKAGTYTDTWEEGVTLESFGEKEGNKISILSNGKNLFDGKSTDCFWFGNVGEKIPNNNINVTQYSIVVPVKKGLQYSFSGYSNIPKSSQRYSVLFTDTNKTIIKTGSIIDKIVAPSDGFVYWYVCSEDVKPYLKDLQVEEGIQVTPYEPYKSNKKDILIKEPLRSLPIGVLDILEENNGQVKINRNVKQFTITDAFNDIKALPSNEKFITFQILLSDMLADNNYSNLDVARNSMCSNFKWIKRAWDLTDVDSKDLEGYSVSNINGSFYIKILKSKLTTPDVNGFKAWLKDNPTEIIYQLATPTVEIVENCVDIDLDTFGEKTYFNILNSLPGTLDFKVPSNIGSVVQNMAKEVNNIWDVINNLLVPSLIETNKNIAMATIKNNLK